MKDGRWLERILLAIIAAGTIVTAVEVSKIAKEGFEIVLTEGEVNEIVEAYEAARSDMEGER